MEVVADKVAAELAGILREVERGTRLLYDGLPVHSLGEGQLCAAVSAHLGRPCIADTECLLRDLTLAAALDVVALRGSSPDLARTLERRAAEVQAAVEVSRAYWLEIVGVLAAQRHAGAAGTYAHRVSLAVPASQASATDDERLAAPSLQSRHQTGLRRHEAWGC